MNLKWLLNIYKNKRNEKRSLEEKSFYNLVFYTIIYLLIFIPVNYLQGLENVHILALTLCMISALVIYFSSIYFRVNLVLPYLIVMVVSFSFFWFSNGGSLGTIPYYFSLSLIASMILLRGKKRNIFFLVNGLVIISLIIIEYKNPDLITYYSSNKKRYLDLTIGSIGYLIILGTMIKVVIDKYDTERKMVNRQAMYLKKNNELLIKKNKEISQKQKELLHVVDNLKKSEQKFRSFFQTAIDVIYILDQKGTILEINPYTYKSLGYSEEEMTNKSLKDFLTPSFKEIFSDNIKKIIANGFNRSEIELVNKNGEILTVDCSATVIKDDNGKIKYIVAYQRDVTKAKKNKEKIKYLAYHDEVTDLGNRRAGLEKLSMNMEKAKKNKYMIGVMFIDLDRFKDVNDTLGHDAGDIILRKVATRLRTKLRKEDTIVRLGGDEFMIIFNPIQSLREISNLAHGIIDVFIKPFMIKGKNIHFTCSGGVSLYPKNGSSTKSLIKNADIALYHAKEEGRNNFKFFNNKLKSNFKRDIQIKEDLIKAVRNKEFIIHYQPKINIETGKITGCEALVRWNHPRLGLLYPHDFIHIAEKYELIRDIDIIVLDKVCKQIKKWQDKKLKPTSVAINISAHQFIDYGFMNLLDEIIEKNNTDPSQINLEITETVAVKKIDFAQKIIKDIKKRNIKISLDDFGKGYSSLNYLRSFQIDVLKIDKTFIDDIISNKVQREIIIAAISIAKVLGIKVVAEGVENKEQLEILKNIKCDEYQGYYFSKPITNEKMEVLLEGNKEELSNQREECV